MHSAVLFIPQSSPAECRSVETLLKTSRIFRMSSVHCEPPHVQSVSALVVKLLHLAMLSSAILMSFWQPCSKQGLVVEQVSQPSVYHTSTARV
jgi:hypothetical protein